MKLIVFYALLLSSCATLSASNGDGGGGPPPCVAKLMPCLNFLRSPEIPPAATCCIPLKSALVDDVSCLCSLFKNVDLIRSFNITQQDLVGLPPRCGLELPDLNKCDRSISPNPGDLQPPPPVNEPPKGITTTPPSSSGRVASILLELHFALTALLYFCTSY
ncbi:non-specific lipid transfer protein GPI-anchored 3-like [Zingiber officinale]|uniref:non-specific lipid transfer protein GPI-anchored 3-like n=1 Tax=Zingiber officinale TaxID=94328 RepID=UPI001C4A81CA|nr:non-specific lipid transfer protein GPI-anchored 3-like [Zingiber officinale]